MAATQTVSAAAVCARRPAPAPRSRATAAAARMSPTPATAKANRASATVARAAAAGFSGSSCALTTSVISPTVAEALAEIQEAVAGGADIVELRIDFIKGLNAEVDIPALLDACPVPAIVTYRPTWQGGYRDEHS